jgi:hypothetical protein
MGGNYGKGGGTFPLDFPIPTHYFPSMNTFTQRKSLSRRPIGTH